MGRKFWDSVHWVHFLVANFLNSHHMAVSRNLQGLREITSMRTYHHALDNEPCNLSLGTFWGCPDTLEDWDSSLTYYLWFHLSTGSTDVSLHDVEWIVHVRGLASRFFIGIVRSASQKPIELVFGDGQVTLCCCVVWRIWNLGLILGRFQVSLNVHEVPKFRNWNTQLRRFVTFGYETKASSLEHLFEHQAASTCRI